MEFLLLLYQLGIRNVARNPRRSFLTIFAISAGLWSALGIASIARGLSIQMALNAIDNLTGHAQVHALKYRFDPAVETSMEAPSDASLTYLNSSDIAAWTYRVRVPAVAMSEREAQGITLLGIDPKQEVGLSFIGKGVIQGANLSGPADRGAVIGSKLADLLRTQTGKRIVIMSEGTDGKIRDRGFKVVGIFDAEVDSSERSFVFIGREIAQEMLGLGSRVSEISIKSHDRLNIAPIVDTLQKIFPGQDVQPWTTLEPLAVAVTKIQNGFLFLWSLIVLVTIAFGLVNTLFMAIFERTRELGLFQALGMKPSWILAQIVLESALLLIIGGAIGNALAFGTVAFFSDGIDLSRFAAGTSQFQISRVLFPTILFRDWIIANAVILLISLLSAFYPAKRASQISALEALGR